MEIVLIITALKGFLVGVCLCLLIAAIVARTEMKERRAKLHLSMAIMAVFSSIAGLLLTIIF